MVAAPLFSSVYLHFFYLCSPVALASAAPSSVSDDGGAAVDVAHGDDEE